MKTLSLVAALFLAAAAACGGTVVVEPIGPGGSSGELPPSGSSGTSGNNPDPTAPTPKAPIGPYTGLVGTTDVSILYPMPLNGASKDFIPAGFMGDHGILLPRETFTTVAGTSLDRTHSIPPSGFDQLVLISLRLDPCSARKGSGCTPEARAVFQAVYTNGTGGTFEDGDTTAGMTTSDGAVHVMYDLSEAELVIMMKQILTLKAANGGLADQVLGVHPILAAQGLGGPFAKGLQAIILEHLGSERIARVTTFDHNMDPDEDGWTFKIFDNVGGSFVAKKIPTTTFEQQTAFGSRAFEGPLTSTGAETFSDTTVADKVDALVARSRPAVGSADRTRRSTPPSRSTAPPATSRKARS